MFTVTHERTSTVSAKYILNGIALLLAVPLLARLYLSAFVRFTADDYCWPANVVTSSFLDLQALFYQKEFGRFASTALISLVAYADNMLTPILPMIMLVLWATALVWFVWEVALRLEIPYSFQIAVIAAEMLLIAVLAGAPDSLQPIYWQTGLLTYLPPLVLLPFAGAFTLRWRSVRLAGPLAFVAGGFNESFMALQVLLFVGMLPFTWKQRSVVLPSLVGAIAAAIVVATSPGNAIRRGPMEPLTAADFVVLTIHQTAILMGHFFATPVVPMILLLAVLVGIIVTPKNHLHLRLLRPSLLVLGTLVLVAGCVATGVFGLRVMSGRAAFIPTVVLAAGAVLMAIHLGMQMQRSIPIGAAAAFLAIACSIASTYQTVAYLPAFKSYAMAQEQQDQALRMDVANGQRQVVVPPAFNPFGLEDVGEPGSRFATPCALRYYGLEAIRLTSTTKPDSLLAGR